MTHVEDQPAAEAECRTDEVDEKHPAFYGHGDDFAPNAATILSGIADIGGVRLCVFRRFFEVYVRESDADRLTALIGDFLYTDVDDVCDDDIPDPEGEPFNGLLQYRAFLCSPAEFAVNAHAIVKLLQKPSMSGPAFWLTISWLDGQVRTIAFGSPEVLT